MALVEDNIKGLLKTYYKDGVESLFFRNSPVVKEITKERVEGKEQNFSAMVGRGGAVGGSFLKAKAQAVAGSGAEVAEFSVTPGQLFSVYTMNTKEVESSKTLKGAYAPIAGAKMFACTEAFRKLVANTFYGTGYGELCHFPDTEAHADGEVTIAMPSHAIMAIDNGSVLVVKTKLDDAEAVATLTVKKINGNQVTCQSKAASGGTFTGVKTQWICLDGSVTSDKKPTLPRGLAAWLPTDRSDENLNKEFFGVVRSKNPDRLAGAYFDGSSLSGTHKYSDSVEGLMQIVRRQGGVGDLIVMNDNDFKKYAKEIETTNTFMTQTSSRGKKEATKGFSKIAAAFSTNYIENIYDDPFCPEGVFYILDKEYIRLWSYTNMDKVNDSISGNAPGKEDVMEAGNGEAERPYGLIIDDYLNIKPGTDTDAGPSTEVSLIAYFAWVVTNPSVNGVGKFPAA